MPPSKSAFDVTIQVDSLQRSFTAITGSQAGMRQEMEFLRNTAGSTGQNMYTLADSYKMLSAATQNTRLEGAKTKDLFVSMTEAAAVLGLSSDRVALSMNAFSQMASKGVVSMEELRLQLGDHLPGAVRIAAQAMGVTTAQLIEMMKNGEVLAEELLPKMARELHKLYGAAAQTASLESGQAAVNQLSQEWTDFKLNITDSSAIIGTIHVITGALKILNAEAGKNVQIGGPSISSGTDDITVQEMQLKRMAYLKREIARIQGNGGDRGLFKEEVAAISDLQKELTSLEKVKPYPLLTGDAIGKIDIATEAWGKHSFMMQGVSRQSESSMKITEKDTEATRLWIQTKEQALELEYKAALKGAITPEQQSRAKDVYEEKLKALQEKGAGGGNSGIKAERAELTQLNALIKNYTNDAKDAAKGAAEWNREAEHSIDGMDRLNEQYATAGMSAFDRVVYEQNREFAEGKAALDAYRASLAEVDTQVATLSAQYQLASARVDEAQKKLAANPAGSSEQDLNKLHALIEARDDLGKELADQTDLQSQLNLINASGAMSEETLAAAIYSTKEAVEAKRQAMVDGLKDSDDFFDNFKAGAMEFAHDSENMGGSIADSVGNGFQSAGDALADFVTTGKMDFSSLANSIISDLARIAIQQSITGVLAGALGSVFGGASGSAGGTVSSNFTAAAVYGSAKGNVFSTPSLSAFSNSIVSQPTYFAKGGNVMGEAGPEAIIPLSRTSNGDLGIKSLGGSGINLEVRIIESPGKGGTQQQRQENGVNVVDVFVDQIRYKFASEIASRDGILPASMESAYNLSPNVGR